MSITQKAKHSRGLRRRIGCGVESSHYRLQQTADKLEEAQKSSLLTPSSAEEAPRVAFSCLEGVCSLRRQARFDESSKLTSEFVGNEPGNIPKERNGIEM